MTPISFSCWRCICIIKPVPPFQTTHCTALIMHHAVSDNSSTASITAILIHSQKSHQTLLSLQTTEINAIAVDICIADTEIRLISVYSIPDTVPNLQKLVALLNHTLPTIAVDVWWHELQTSILEQSHSTHSSHVLHQYT